LVSREFYDYEYYAKSSTLAVLEIRSFYGSVTGPEHLRGVIGPVGLAYLAVGQGSD
jgi:hypothetical protein